MLTQTTVVLLHEYFTLPFPLSLSAPSRIRILAAFVSLYVLWGSTYLGIRVAIDAMPPLLMAGTRYMVAGGLLYGVMRLLAKAPAPTATGWRNATLIGGGCRSSATAA